MSNNSNGTGGTDSNVTQFPNELFQLRDILFGEDKREFQEHFKSLEESTNDQLQQLKSEVNSEIADLKALIEQQFAKLSERLADVDHLQEERSNQIADNLDNTAARLSSFEQQTEKNTATNLNQIEKSLNALTQSLADKHESTLTKIAEVSDKLQNDKADRALLSQVLISAAKKLEEPNG